MPARSMAAAIRIRKASGGVWSQLRRWPWRLVDSFLRARHQDNQADTGAREKPREKRLGDKPLHLPALLVHGPALDLLELRRGDRAGIEQLLRLPDLFETRHTVGCIWRRRRVF